MPEIGTVLGRLAALPGALLARMGGSGAPALPSSPIATKPRVPGRGSPRPNPAGDALPTVLSPQTSVLDNLPLSPAA
jgi:hypothetical protein